MSIAASASKMAFLSMTFALVLADEGCDDCDVCEECDAQDMRERAPTFHTLLSGLTYTWKEFISLDVLIPVSHTSTLSCMCSTWSKTKP